MKKLIVFVLWIAACGGETEPQVLRSSSEPVVSTPVAMDLGAVRRPDGKSVLRASHLRLSDLTKWVSGTDDLNVDEEQVLLDAVNQTTAACEPCMSEGMSLGSCLQRALASCTNLPTLVQRAFRVAIQGGELSEAQQAISFVEPWQELPAQDTSAEGVSVTLAVDYLDPFTHRAWKSWQVLKAEYGDALRFQFLHAPHERHTGADELSKLALKARILGKEMAFHEAVMAAGESPKLKELRELPLFKEKSEYEVELQQRLDPLLLENISDVNRLGVDSTPIAWVDGYRVSGLRSVDVLQRFVDLALAD